MASRFMTTHGKYFVLIPQSAENEFKYVTFPPREITARTYFDFFALFVAVRYFC